MQLTINKVAAGVVGLAMVAGLAFAFTATRAHAITLSELVELFIALEVIPEDKADEARAVLDGQEDETPSVDMSCYFSRDLNNGATGPEVMELQKFLNAQGYTVAVSGAGSPGMETEYYGPATAGAVAAFQEAYASTILTPLGLTAGTGYFGASTRAQANELCADADDTPDTPDLPGDEDEDMDDDNDLSGGEASLEDFDKSSDYGDEQIDEGEEDAEVYGFQFDVEDADVEVNRIDIRLENGTNDQDPWEVFDEISLWYDGEKIASENADDEDDWGNETGDAFSMRFSGLDVVVDEGDTAEFVVAVSVGNIDDADMPMTWSIWVEDDGVRARDGAGINQYIGDADLLTNATEEETFDIESASADTEGNITTSNSNPDSSIIKVEENDRSDEVAVLVADYESEDGETTLNKLVFFATTSDTKLNTVINDVTLEIDGNRFTEWYYADTAAGSAVADPDESGYIVFDLEDEDDEYDVDTDEEVEIQLLVEFKQQSGNYAQGATVEFDVDSTAVSGWLVDDVDGDDLAGDLGGTANGEVHQLYTQGIFAEIVSTDETKTAGDNNANDVGDFEIEFDLTAFDDTFYVSATNTAVITYHIENGSGATVSATSSVALTSTAKKESNAYRIDDGETETFTLTVTLNPASDGYYRIELDSITYGDDTNAAGSTHTASPDEDFETGVLYLNA